MEITHRIRIDMLRKGVPPVVDAMQFDAFTRVVEIELFSNGVAWNPPAGITFALSYGKPDGKRGFYEALPDGNSAISVSGNVVSVTLAPQALTVAGTVLASLVMRIPETDRLSSFPFEIHVMADPSAGSTDSEDYFDPSLGGGIPIPESASVGQFFRVKEVDENGKVTAVEAVDLNAETPTAYLYNGIQLPPLPAYDRAKYPYAVICTYREGNAFGAIIPASAVLYLFTAHPEPSGDTIELWLPQIGDLEYKIQAETTQGLQAFTDWGSPTTITERKGPSIANMKWANFDLYYQTDIDGKKGQLYLAATEPVAVSAPDVRVPVMLNLKDYGIDYASLLLAGGGAVIYEDVGSFWEDVNKVKPGQTLLLTSSFSDALIVPPPATLYFLPTESNMPVQLILSTMTFYVSGKLLTASSYLVPYGTSGAAISMEVTSMGDIEAALDAILAIQNELIGGDGA